MSNVNFRGESQVSIQNGAGEEQQEDDDNKSSSSEESIHRAALYLDKKRFLALAMTFMVCSLNILAEGSV